MRRHLISSFALALLLAALLAAPLQAQPTAADRQSGRPPAMGRPAEGVQPHEVQRLFDAYVFMRAQDELKLNESQMSSFLSRLKSLQETRRRNQRERHQLLQELSRLSADAGTDEGQLRERLAKLRDLEARSAVDLRREYDELDQILDVRQQARFRVFEEQIERRKFDLLMRARRRAAGARLRGDGTPDTK